MIDNILHCNFSETTYSITSDIKKAKNRERGNKRKMNVERRERQMKDIKESGGEKDEWGECEREGERFVCVHKCMYVHVYVCLCVCMSKRQDYKNREEDKGYLSR